MIKFDKSLVSKLLVFEDDKDVQVSIKEVLDSNGLVAVRQHSYSAMKVLYSNIDLGGVLIGEASHDSAEGIHDGFELAVRIHKIRPELPIFLRREQDTVDDLTEEQQAAIAGVYTLDNPDKLLEIIERFVADTEYPISLIRRIEEVTLSSLESTFKNTTVKMALPYLVKDKLSYGDITSLLPVQAPWFNGYMMFQSEEEPMLGLIDADKTSMESQNADFRVVMGLLSEISNIEVTRCSQVQWTDTCSPESEVQLHACKPQIPVASPWLTTSLRWRCSACCDDAYRARNLCSGGTVC